MFGPVRPIRPLGARRPVGAPLVRGLVVGGAAYAAGRSAPRPQRAEQDQDEAVADLRAQRQQVSGPVPQDCPAAPGRPAAPPCGGPPPYPPPAQAPVPDLADKLTELGRMVQQGLLTPEEFSTAKTRLLGT